MTNSNNKVDSVYRTPQFNKAYKKLVKDNRKDVVEKINETIKKLINFEISTQQHNHPLKNNIRDIHITGDVILLYRYVNDSLIITLELHDLTDHKNLNKNLNKIK